jgi:hypothetical protein
MIFLVSRLSLACVSLNARFYKRVIKRTAQNAPHDFGPCEHAGGGPDVGDEVPGLCTGDGFLPFLLHSAAAPTIVGRCQNVLRLHGLNSSMLRT